MKADRGTVEKLVKTARGQLDGILRMIEQDRYCMDISNQILAAQAVLTRANKEILKAFLSTEFGGGRHAGRVEKIMALEG